MLNMELLRRNKRWSQGHLAAAAGVTQGLISQIEAGVHVPGEDVLERLARALCFSPPERLLRDVHVELGPEP
jgi:transcriptional regulator with XRE-family HTH domain